MSSVSTTRPARARADMRLLSAALVVGICGQFFLAGLSIFSDAALWSLHGAIGGGLSLPVIGLLALSLASRSAQRYRRRTVLLFCLYCLQILLVFLGRELGLAFVSALHPVNGLFMMGAAVGLVNEAFGGQGEDRA